MVICYLNSRSGATYALTAADLVADVGCYCCYRRRCYCPCYRLRGHNGHTTLAGAGRSLLEGEVKADRNSVLLLLLNIITMIVVAINYTITIIVRRTLVSATLSL